MAINVKDKLVTLESLGVAYSTEQDAREEADQALSTRIDNIVAPEGDPSLTEVSDARVSGSTTYNTLKARLDADKAAIGTEISQLSESLEDVSGGLGNIIEVTDSVNRFNGTWLDGYINLSGASGGSGEYANTDKIPVLGTSFVFTGSSIVNGKRMNIPCRFITAYDDNENLLSAYGLQRVGSDNSFIDTDGVNIITLDASVKSIVLSVYKPSIKYTDVCVSFDTSVTDYVPYGGTTKIKTSLLSDSKYATIYSYLHGKTIAVFGDSIMYGAGSDSKGAVDLLAEKYGMTVAKYCVSGATMGVRTDSPSYTVDEAHHIAKQVRNAIADSISPDIIVFNGGTNDIGGGITIGTISEVYTQPATENYFADGFEMVAYLLTNAFVGVPIIYMRAHNMSSRSYTGQVQYGELGNEISRKWGIATVDMYKKMNTQLAAYRTLYLADYTHPNANGYKKYYIPALEDYVMSALAEVN